MVTNRSKLATASTLSFLLSTVFASGDFSWSDSQSELQGSARVIEEKISQLRTSHSNQANEFLKQLEHVKSAKTYEGAKSNALHATDKMSKDDEGNIRQLTVNRPERKELRNVCQGHTPSASYTLHSNACDWVRSWRTHLNHDPTIDPSTIKADYPREFTPVRDILTEAPPILNLLPAAAAFVFSPVTNAIHSYNVSCKYKHKPLPPHQSTCDKYRQEWTTVAQARTETISLIHIHNAFMELHNLMVCAENRRRTDEQEKQQKQAITLRNKELENDRLIKQRKLEHQRGLEFQARVRQEADKQRQAVAKKQQEADRKNVELETARLAARQKSESQRQEALKQAVVTREVFMQQESARRNDVLRENTAATSILEQERLEHLRLSRESQNRREYREARERERSQRDNSQQSGQTTNPSLRPSYYVQSVRR